MDRELYKQFKRIDKKEKRILNKKESKLVESKITLIKHQIQGKIPKKLKSTLESAFAKGFQLVFEKGDAYIEKTYKKDRIQLEHELNNYAIDKELSRRYIKRLDKQAKYSKITNTSLTVIEGGILGFLGIGLPDIPLFIAVILRSIYEVALGYGFDYKSDREKAYILLIICGAMSQGEIQKSYNDQLDMLGSQIDKGIETHINLKARMNEASKVLSEALLVSKFVQGIPVVGAVGGVVNYTIINKISRYSSLKYKKRYLLKKAR